MTNNFSLGQVLPTTKYLKISWTQTSAMNFLLAEMNVRTNNDAFSLVQTKIESVESDFNPNDVDPEDGPNPVDIDIDYDLVIAEKNIIASWKKSLNRSPEWLVNCGINSGESCLLKKFVIVNTLSWSLAKRTISSITSTAISSLTWEDLSLPETIAQVHFNSTGGTYIGYYGNVIIGSTITKPDDPVKENFDFVSWYTDLTFTTEWDFDVDIVTNSMTLYAKWDFDESNLGMATYDSEGVVILSSALSLTGLQDNEKVIVEKGLKNIWQEVIDDLEEALDEV